MSETLSGGMGTAAMGSELLLRSDVSSVRYGVADDCCRPPGS